MLPIQLRSQPVRSAKRVVVSAVAVLLCRQHRAFVLVTAACSEAQGPWVTVVLTTMATRTYLHALTITVLHAVPIIRFPLVPIIRAALTRALRSVVAFIPVADSQAVIPEEASLEVAEASLPVVRSVDVDKL